MIKSAVQALLLLALAVIPVSGQNLEELARQLEAAKDLYNDKMIELEKVSSDRWKARQKAVLEKEQNQEVLTQNRSAVELLYSETARAREEKLSREELVMQEQEKLTAAESEWKAVTSAVDQKRNALSDESGGVFPIGYEQRMAAAAAVDNQFPGNRYPAELLKGMVKTQADQLRDSKRTVVEKGVIVDDRNHPVEVTWIRMGHALAAAHADSSAWYLTFYGENASVPFKWNLITDPVMNSQIQALTGSAAAGSKVLFPVDVMQNEQSRLMVGGGRLPLKEKVLEFIRKGGFIMIPLILTALWAVIIVLNRIVVFAVHHRRDYAFINKAVKLLEEKKISEAKSLAETGRGVLARILSSCLKHTDQSRQAAEQSVKEQLLGEMPALEKHLDTLAVIAGASPLLGLLGTVTGMITMFDSITMFGTGDPKLLAGGISEALITTEVGLFIAIPVLLTHNWLRNRRNAIQAEMEIYAMRILNRIWPAE